MDVVLPEIKIGTIPNILVLGNGINRSFGNDDWRTLLSGISCTSFEDEEQACIEKLPFPLQAVVATSDNVDEGVELIAKKWLLHDGIEENQTKIIKDLLKYPFDAILTTNYTYDIERAINPSFKCKIEKKSGFRKTVIEGSTLANRLGMYKYMQLSDDATTYRIWHIHGELCRPKSMILGHYYYGKSIRCISDCVSSFFRRYNGMKNTGKFIPHSWVDYFMLGNVYIVGLGLDPSEADLWWLINCKKIHSKDFNGGQIHWFEPNLNSKGSFAKKALAEAYDIKCHTKPVGKDGYKAYYQFVAKDLFNYMQEC